MRKAFISNQKSILSGGMFERWYSEDDTPFAIGLERKPRGSGGVITPLSEEEQAKKDKKNMLESYHTFLRIAAANFSPRDSIFVTLTFADTKDFDITNVDDCNKCFDIAMKRFRRKLGKAFSYSVTIEFQEKNGRGAVHYHMLMNLPFVQHSLLREMWGYGGVYVKKVRNTLEAINYLAKYMRKGEMDERLRGRKKFWGSRNLKKPKEMYGDIVTALWEYIQSLPPDKKKEYSENVYFSEYRHTIIHYNKIFLPEDVIADFLSTYGNYNMNAV